MSIICFSHFFVLPLAGFMLKIIITFAVTKIRDMFFKIIFYLIKCPHGQRFLQMESHDPTSMKDFCFVGAFFLRRIYNGT